MYDNLLQHVHKFVPLTEAEAAQFMPYLQNRIVQKKEYLLKEGQVCDAVYFVSEGCLRQYYLNDNGTEQIIQFAVENWWMSDYISLEDRKASDFNIQAIEKSSIFYISYKDQLALFEKLPKLERYFRLVVQRAYAASLVRIQYLFTLTGEERYHHFQQSYPAFVQRIPQYMLASYLGFTPEFLSKIRARK
jgi:CRP/FNR family transcriptional regulator